MTSTSPQTSLVLDIDLVDLAPQGWFAALDALGDEHGYFEQIGAAHSALFIDAGRDLLVTFETVDAARRGPGAAPRGLDHVSRNNWSLLAFFSDGETWFRDPRIWGTLDRLSDDGFFEDFERVLFQGTGSCGYAAAACSVAAPGARVLALRPQATLDPALTGWDRRHIAGRRRDFTSRYGYAPEMLDAADQAWIVHDPAHAPDAMHAALFHRPNVTLLRCPHGGARLDQMLDAMQISAPLTESAMAGTLTPASFARLWRARRDNPTYLRGLLKRLEADKRDGLTAHLCAHGLKTRDHDLFARKLASLGQAPPLDTHRPGQAAE